MPSTTCSAILMPLLTVQLTGKASTLFTAAVDKEMCIASALGGVTNRSTPQRIQLESVPVWPESISVGHFTFRPDQLDDIDEVSGQLGCQKRFDALVLSIWALSQ